MRTTKNFQVQHMDRGGNWNENTDCGSLDEAIRVADDMARHNPRCAWGVRVWNVDAQHVSYEP